jgi:hypothetical protein
MKPSPLVLPVLLVVLVLSGAPDRRAGRGAELAAGRQSISGSGGNTRAAQLPGVR